MSNDHFLNEGPLHPSDAAVALVVVDGTRYLMQLRDQKPGIFFPGHWGVFGGAVDPGENVEQALAREMEEELALRHATARYFTSMDIDFGYCGLGIVKRSYFEIAIKASDIDRLILGEGSQMCAFEARTLLNNERVVPYDAFAIWMHATQSTIRGSRPARGPDDAVSA